MAGVAATASRDDLLMGTQIRCYRHAGDYEAISRFLIDTHEPGESFANWLQPRWEYMHHHPDIEDVDLASFGVVEEDGLIVGLTHLEHSPGLVYFQLRPGYDHVAADLLDHAEAHFGGFSRTLGRDVRGLYISEAHGKLAALAAERGYIPMPRYDDVHARYVLSRPVEPVPMPMGFRLQSLADENDLTKIHRCLHRGFNHRGEPDPEGIAGRAFMQSAPNFDRELTIVAISPHGDYVSFGGMWFVPENRIAYVEPVATDPHYRHLGLGRAVVLESVRRVAARGAEVAWVGSDQDFYSAIGFAPSFAVRFWVKDL